jgi:hypothetical protein
MSAPHVATKGSGPRRRFVAGIGVIARIWSFRLSSPSSSSTIKAVADKVLSPHRNGPLSVLDGDRFHEVVALVRLLLNPESPA